MTEPTEADHPALRHLLAQALARHDAVHARYSHGFAPRYGVDPETDGFVDAVTAVMGATADRAGVLREAADRIDETRDGFPIAVWNGITWATAELRRMAAESAPDTTPRPVQHAPGKAVLCPDCRAKGHSVCVAEQPAAAQQPKEVLP